MTQHTDEPQDTERLFDISEFEVEWCADCGRVIPLVVSGFAFDSEGFIICLGCNAYWEAWVLQCRRDVYEYQLREYAALPWYRRLIRRRPTLWVGPVWWHSVYRDTDSARGQYGRHNIECRWDCPCRGIPWEYDDDEEELADWGV